MKIDNGMRKFHYEIVVAVFGDGQIYLFEDQTNYIESYQTIEDYFSAIYNAKEMGDISQFKDVKLECSSIYKCKVIITYVKHTGYDSGGYEWESSEVFSDFELLYKL